MHRQVVFSAQFPFEFQDMIFIAMKMELDPKQILAVRCPTCAALPGVRCTLSLGHPRNQPHVDRRRPARDHQRTNRTLPEFHPSADRQPDEKLSLGVSLEMRNTDFVGSPDQRPRIPCSFCEAKVDLNYSQDRVFIWPCPRLAPKDRATSFIAPRSQSGPRLGSGLV